jgi:hypothetical protein
MYKESGPKEPPNLVDLICTHPSQNPTITTVNLLVLCRIPCSNGLASRANPVHMRHKTGCGISGDPSPSEADMRLTRRLVEASRILQVHLVDHVIIGAPAPGRNDYFSFKEAGVIG